MGLRTDVDLDQLGRWHCLNDLATVKLLHSPCQGWVFGSADAGGCKLQTMHSATY